MEFSWPDKTTVEKRVYGIDWADRLDGRTIVSVENEVVRGDVEFEDSNNTDTKTIVWLFGGTAGTICVVRTLVTLSDGQKLDGLGEFKIK